MLLSALLSLLAPVPAAGAPVDEATPTGRYVEARTATVFAGACHYGSEYTLAGRSAVLGVEFTGGEHAGVELRGLDLVAVVTSDRNLAEAEGRKRSRLLLPDTASEAQREALEAWARVELVTVLGEITSVVTQPTQVSFTGEDGFALSAGGGDQAPVALEGHGLPDRSCCTMPFQRWYTSLVPLKGDRVGFAEEFRLQVPELGVRVRRGEDNCAFYGRF